MTKRIPRWVTAAPALSLATCQAARAAIVLDAPPDPGLIGETL